MRILSATNRDLLKEVEAGRFRDDLYYRINIMSLKMPPLRERIGDIPLLVRHFMGPGWDIEPEAMAALERYPWPGNIRQLSNAVERAKIMADDGILRLGDFPPEVVAHDCSRSVTLDMADDLSTLARAKIVEVLRREKGNKTRAAKRLGIDRRKLYRLVEKYQISSSEWESPADQPGRVSQ